MGVVNVMGSVGQPPAVLGKMIGGALVGTFLGILISYGFVAPVAGSAGAEGRRGRQDLSVHEGRVACQHEWLCPQVAVEFGRKVLFSTDRPGFAELEEAIKSKK
jgi:chemotaxis protein MotA